MKVGFTDTLMRAMREMGSAASPSVSASKLGDGARSSLQEFSADTLGAFCEFFTQLAQLCREVRSEKLSIDNKTDEEIGKIVAELIRQLKSGKAQLKDNSDRHGVSASVCFKVANEEFRIGFGLWAPPDKDWEAQVYRISQTEGKGSRELPAGLKYRLAELVRPTLLTFLD